MFEFAFAPDLRDTAETEVVTARNGVAQLRRTWAAADPRGVVVISHGIAEHCGRYEHVARQLKASGFTVIGFDQRGHGATEGRQGYVASFAEFHDDVEDHLAVARTYGVPVVLLGHSMGGLISTSYVLDRDRPRPDLVLLSAPALALSLPRPAAGVASVLGRAVGRASIKLPLDPEGLSTDPRVGETYMADPLVDLKQSLALVGSMVRTARGLEDELDEWDVPTFVGHGTDDEIVHPSASELIGTRPTVERRLYEGLRHELFNEPSGPQVVADMIAWIDGRRDGE
ncbi:MAG: lysophospholipase [Actinomycetota bacterium]